MKKIILGLTLLVSFTCLANNIEPVEKKSSPDYVEITIDLENSNVTIDLLRSLGRKMGINGFFSATPSRELLKFINDEVSSYSLEEIQKSLVDGRNAEEIDTFNVSSCSYFSKGWGRNHRFPKEVNCYVTFYSREL